MADRLDDRRIAEMVLGFVRNAGGSDAVGDLCKQLLDAQEKGSVCLPVSEEQTAALKTSGLVSLLPETERPFLFDAEKNLLYTRRNWMYESCVRQRIGSMAEQAEGRAVTVPADGEFSNLKPCQRRAIEKMTRRQFTILTGGPGTGKTYTISRAVKLIREQDPDVRRIALAAPTGKAAARVREAMGDETLPATTIHALLGANYDFVTFRHDRNHPLALDWLIVDEASMIDLPLMAKLLDALARECKLTLVGDANQLTSVEPGHVFGDLCAMPELQDSIAELTESSRIKDAKEILQLAEAVNGGDSGRVLELLKGSAASSSPSGATADGPLCYCHLNSGEGGEESATFREIILRKWEHFALQRTPEAALSALNGCRVLCATRRGPYGSERINRFILRLFRQAGPVPLMITRNDANLGVSNGDVGVLLPGDETHLYLPAEGAGKVRAVPTALLPDLEMAFATTIHKSQGSEFDHVVIVLPPVPEGANAAGTLTRELLYTAITRAKRSVTVFAGEQTIADCCRRRTERCTGLQG